ncbi:MAG: hypothetical protein NC418_04135 [Muribaculaceae bacterium]|nr:hypothetical protein [Muribaculaceae bacterium]
MSTTGTHGNPWHGLRAYSEGELIYGRDSEIHALSMLIVQNVTTVVYGRSGIGKSSILSAGIFPQMRRRGIFPVYIRLDHSSGAPSYREQIKSAVAAQVALLGYSAEELVAADGSETLWEFFHRFDYSDAAGHRVRPLVVFDQFEEIFTLATDRRKVQVFFRQLADLINNVMPDVTSTAGHSVQETVLEQPAGNFFDLNLGALGGASLAYRPEADYHLVFTLREDFLSYLERNTTDIPALKNNRYCLAPINEEQAAEIIMRPRPGLVSPAVAHLIIEKVTGEADFKLDGIPEIQVDSAILSLYLSRLYDKMVELGLDCIHEPVVVAYSDNIIDDFYTDAIAGLPVEAVEWLEDTLVNADGRRDNRDRNTVLRATGLTEADYRHLVDEVKLLRQFSYGGDLRVEYIHDVICPVVMERRRLREETRRTIEADRRAAEAEQRAEAERLRARRRMRRIWLGIALGLVMISQYLFAIYWFYDCEDAEYYTAFTLRQGWPVGLGPELSRAERARTPLFYKLSHRGHFSRPFDRVEVCSSNEALPASPRLALFDLAEAGIISDRAAERYDSLLSEVRTLVFNPLNDSEVDKIIALDGSGATLFSVNRSEMGGADWYAFVDPSGMSMPVRDNGLDRVRVSTDEFGDIASVNFYDSRGAKRPDDQNVHDVYGYSYSTKIHDGHEGWFRIPLSQYGDAAPYEDCRLTIYRDGGVETSWWDKDMSGYHYRMTICKTFATPDSIEYYSFDYDTKTCALAAVMHNMLDTKGNPVLQALDWVDENKDAIGMSVYDTTKCVYDDKGRVISKKSYTKRYYDGIVETWSYAPDGRVASYIIVADGQERYRKTREKIGNVTRSEIHSRRLTKVIYPYRLRVDSVVGERTFTAIFDRNGRAANDFGGDSLFHRMVVDTDSASRTVRYWHIDADGKERRGRIDSPEYIVEEHFNPDGTLEWRTVLDADSAVVSTQMYFYTSGVLSGRAVRGIDGTPVRCPDYDIDGFGYYRLSLSTDFDGNYTGITAFNELNEDEPITYQGNPIAFNYGNMNGAEIDVTPAMGRRMIAPRVKLTGDYSQIYPERYRTLGGDKSAVFVHLLSPDAPLARLGLKDNDVILRPDGTPADTEAEARRLLRGKTLTVARRHRGRPFTKVEVELDGSTDYTHSIHLHPLFTGFWFYRHLTHME